MTAEQTYLAKLKTLAPASFRGYPPPPGYSLKECEPGVSTSRFAHWHRDENLPIRLLYDADAVLAQCRDDIVKDVPSVLLVQNISPELTAMLGVAFGIDEQQWLPYLNNPSGPSAWDVFFRSTGRANVERIAREAHWRPDTARLDDGHKICKDTSMIFTGQLGSLSAFAQSGTLQKHSYHHRLEFRDANGLASPSTNMTYFLLANTVCLFLVDACIGFHRPRSPWVEPEWPVLRVPCSNTCDGLIIPRDRAYSECDDFTLVAQFLTATPHRQTLIADGPTRRVVDPISLAYYIAASMHRSNLRAFESRIRDISFKQLLSDDANDLQRLNEMLHQQREELVVLQSQVAHAKKTMHPAVRQHLARLPTGGSGDCPLVTFDEMQSESAELQRFLMDTFHLLTSTINIKDAKLSIEQAARATRLTQLATVYLPLTLVTGIFGMNIHEIRQAEPHWWACIVTLLLVALLTSSLLLGQAVWKEWKSGNIREIKAWWSVQWIRRKWYQLWKP